MVVLYWGNLRSPPSGAIPGRGSRPSDRVRHLEEAPVHSRAHQAKDLRNLVPTFAHIGRSLLVPVIVALVVACGADERTTGPQDVPAPVVPAAAPVDATRPI